MPETKNRDWKGTTFGNQWMHHSLIRMIRISDVRLFYIFSALFIIPIYIIFGSGYGIVYDFYRHRLGMDAVHSFFMVYRNYYSFSKAVIDKFAMAAGKRFNISVQGDDIIQRLYDKESGFVQLSSHVGNFEIAGFTMNSYKKPMNVVVFAGEKESILEMRRNLFSKTNMKMIPIGEGINHIFMMDAALRNKEIVSVPADRLLGSGKNVEINFLGSAVRLPEGPFRLATARGVDVISMHVMKISAKEYCIYIKNLEYDKNADKKAQIGQLAAEYIEELERMVKLYPEQWYNFFEFWKA